MTAGPTSGKPRFQVCGGGHLDRHLWLQSDPVMGRTNAARQTISTGGVAANIASHLAAYGGEVRFVGVQPADEAPAMADSPGGVQTSPNVTTPPSHPR